MTRPARNPLAAPRPGVAWLLAALVAVLLEPVPAGSAAGAEERDPQRELILLASGSIEGNLEPCG